MSKLRVIIGISIVVGAVAASINFDRLRSLGMFAVAEMSLTSNQVAAIARCEHPGWYGAARVLVQDLDLECGSFWLGDQLGASAEPSWKLLWLQSLANDEARGERQRFRAAMGGLFRGREAPPNMALMADKSGLSEVDWENLWRARANRTVDTSWMDPVMAERALLWEFGVAGQGEFDLARLEPIALRWSVGRWGATHQKKLLISQYWHDAGFGDGQWGSFRDELREYEERSDIVLDRIDQVIQHKKGLCADSDSNRCLGYAVAAWRASNQVDPEDWAGPEAVNEVELPPGPLSEMLALYYGERSLAIEAAYGFLESVGAWVGEESSYSTQRLQGLLLRPRGLPSVSDPTMAFSDHHNTPWCTALGVRIALGARVVVSRSSTDGDSPYIEFEEVSMRIAENGQGVVEQAGNLVPMDLDDLLGLAAVEMSSALAHQERFVRADVMAGFAERTSDQAFGVSALLTQRCFPRSESQTSLGRRLGQWSHDGGKLGLQVEQEEASLGARILDRRLGPKCVPLNDSGSD